MDEQRAPDVVDGVIGGVAPVPAVEETAAPEVQAETATPEVAEAAAEPVAAAEEAVEPTPEVASETAAD